MIIDFIPCQRNLVFVRKPSTSTYFDAKKNQPRNKVNPNIGSIRDNYDLSSINCINDNPPTNSSLLNLAVNSVLNGRLRFLINLMQMANDVYWWACVLRNNVSYFLYHYFSVCFFSGTIRPTLEELSRQYHSQKKKPPRVFCCSVADSFRRGFLYVSH